MKVFLVNLDKNPERLAAADAQLRKLGVEYERFPAVYGADLPKAEKRQAVNRFRWWCAVGRPSGGGVRWGGLFAMARLGVRSRITPFIDA